jgi:methylated-DNA-[protein]-cysteine S-methyltransferase
MLRFDTAIGTCGLDWDAEGITRVCLPRERDMLHARDTGAAQAPGFVTAAVRAIGRLLDGEAEDLLAVPLSHPGRDAFARRVYAITRATGPGAVTTYGAIARELGETRPAGMARAVGAALGANPTPIIVPCHRVLASDGSLHGFSAPGGLATKRRMLEIEGAPGFTQQPLFV